MQSLNVKVPNNFRAERKYIINTILNDFLGLDYALSFMNDCDCIEISFSDCKVIINDAFWNEIDEKQGYLNIPHLPLVRYVDCQYSMEKNLPVLYGTGKITLHDNRTIECDIDIFAGAFFMLSRWEEAVITNRDEHGRFRAIDSVAYKAGFLNRPLVNEYVELLWMLMETVGMGLMRIESEFKLIPTHDIDWLYQSNYRLQSIKNTIYSLIKKGNLRLASYNLLTLFKRDPFDTYDYLIKQSNLHNLTSHFYFMAADAGTKYHNKDNYLQHPLFRKVIDKIKRSGNIIGFHPSYFSSTDESIWTEEHNKLLNSIGTFDEGRQHFLLVNVPETLRIWDKNKMKIDSSLGYADYDGFRCGTGNEFHFFDVFSKSTLSLKERPLIVMDGTLNGYRKLNVEQAYECIKHYIDMGKRYNMPITILFHNSSFTTPLWNGWKKLYQRILSLAD